MYVTIDTEALRQELLDDSRAAFYGGGFGGALYESFAIERATPQELADLAQSRGMDLRPYIIDETPEEDRSEQGWNPFRW